MISRLNPFPILLCLIYGTFLMLQPPAAVASNHLTPVYPFFTENRGQFPDPVLFQARMSEASVYLCRNDVVTVFKKSDEKMPGRHESNLSSGLRHRERRHQPERTGTLSIVVEMVDANKNVPVKGVDPLSHYNNFFLGPHRENWRTNVANYRAVLYENIYDGIDIKYYGFNGRMEYDFIIKPGADPDQIGISYKGIKSLRISDAGELLVETDWGTITEKKPLMYQLKQGIRIPVQGEFDLISRDTFRFKISDAYDNDSRLIIDPEIAYSTYLGGNYDDTGYDVAVDSSGCMYVTGYTNSTDFPTENPFQGTHGGGAQYSTDVFVTKLNGSGNALVYSTYIGGSDSDYGYAIALDAGGCAYVTGSTKSDDFPTQNPYQGAHGGGSGSYHHDAFVLKLSASGDNLVYSTYLGGNHLDKSWGIEVDASGSAYITGGTASDDFPTQNPFQDHLASVWGDVFVTKLNAQGDNLLYSTYIGGSGGSGGCDIAIDSGGNAYITGSASNGFPVKNPYQASLNDWDDVFVTKLNAQGDDLVYSTYLGGALVDCGFGIAVDSSGHAYVTGITGLDPEKYHDPTVNQRENDFPTKNPFQGPGGDVDAFVTKMNIEGNDLAYSTYLGGIHQDGGEDIAVNTRGNAFVIGSTDSSNFPRKDPLQDYQGCEDVFLTIFNTAGSDLIFSTYIGGTGFDYGYGMALDAAQAPYLTGSTYSTNFPTVNPYQAFKAQRWDAFLIKMTPLPIVASIWLEESTEFQSQAEIKGKDKRTFKEKKKY